MTLQSYKNIIRPARHVIFLRSESTKKLFSSIKALASRRFRLARKLLLLRQQCDIRQGNPFSLFFPERVAPFRETRQRRAEPPTREGTQKAVPANF